MYSKDFFDLQIQCAEKIASILGKGVSEALIEYTGFYKTFKVPGWDFDQENPIWKAYIGHLGGSNLVDATYEYYLETQKSIVVDSDIHGPFGCFSYEFDSDDNSIELHFANRDESEPGALSIEKLEERKKELKELFEDVSLKFPQTKIVIGFSWLHNLSAYKRLYPESYYENVKTIHNWFRTGAIWGQFLDSAGEVKKEMKEDFLERLEKIKSVEELDSCFSYHILEPCGGINDFYQFYGVG